MDSKQSTGVLDIPRKSNKRQRQIGRIVYSASVNSVEILSGLQPADKVIISDMSAWDAFNRIRLE